MEVNQKVSVVGYPALKKAIRKTRENNEKKGKNEQQDYLYLVCKGATQSQAAPMSHTSIQSHTVQCHHHNYSENIV